MCIYIYIYIWIYTHTFLSCIQLMYIWIANTVDNISKSQGAIVDLAPPLYGKQVLGGGVSANGRRLGSCVEIPRKTVVVFFVSITVAMELLHGCVDVLLRLGCGGGVGHVTVTMELLHGCVDVLLRLGWRGGVGWGMLPLPWNFFLAVLMSCYPWAGGVGWGMFPLPWNFFMPCAAVLPMVLAPQHR